MKRSIFVLTLVLVVQLGLAFALYYGTAGPTGAENQQKLLNIDSAQIDGVELHGADQAVVTLKKSGDGWVLPDHFGAPAAAAKVEDLLSTLSGITRPWPVAKTADAAKRFKVEDKDYERRLVFSSQGKPQATLLLGSSPGYRKVHARVDGEQQIYDIPFSTFQASLKAEDWIDRKQLQVKPEEISSVELPDCRLTRGDGKIELDQLQKNEQTNLPEAQKLLEKLADLQISDIYDKADQALPNPVELRVKLTLKDGGSREYGFAKGDKPDYEVLQVAGAANLFKINSGMIKALQEFDRNTLAQAKPAAAPKEESAGKTPVVQQHG